MNMGGLFWGLLDKGEKHDTIYLRLNAVQQGHDWG